MSKWCSTMTMAGHTCRRPVGHNGATCWQHTLPRKAEGWECQECGQILKSLQQMAGKEVTAKQVWMVKSLLRTRQVSAANVAEANLLLGASLSSGAGRDVIFIIIHQLLHRPTRGDYRKSYLS